ncbi:MAG: TIGR02588 family protein [Leptolyngbya sp. SIO4C5]|nr:TIGR02588 family protein [Leptolyngbya sp. SIO4C5]
MPNSPDSTKAPAPVSEHENTIALADPPRTLAEWITLGVTTLILAILVGLVVYDWRVNQNRPPAFQVEITETARVTDSHYYVPFEIVNTGGRIARTVQVTAELHIDGIDDETGEQQIDFLSGNERKRGSFVFNHNPQAGELIIRVASYRLP